MALSLIQFLIARSWPVSETGMLRWTATMEGGSQQQRHAVVRLMLADVVSLDTTGHFHLLGAEEVVRASLVTAGIDPDQEARLFFGARAGAAGPDRG